ncbi:invasion associated locus B family protein [Mesorhizobium sp. KR9-304]|uniref:invasion associated locus B family protein n=1 Tax=Mesorhizobium sp. KR9-304 TaxID=3156614 RepID=UPI0032B38AE2
MQSEMGDRRRAAAIAQIGAIAIGVLAALTNSALAAPWTRQCQGPAGSEAEQCIVQQNVTVGREVIMVASFGIPGPDRQPAGTITIPLNTKLSAGLSVRVDGNPETLLRFDHCSRQGCRSTFEVSASLLKTMLSGQALHTTWQGIDGKTVQLQFDLSGFKAAWSSVAQARQ